MSNTDENNEQPKQRHRGKTGVILASVIAVILIGTAYILSIVLINHRPAQNVNHGTRLNRSLDETTTYDDDTTVMISASTERIPDTTSVERTSTYRQTTAGMPTSTYRTTTIEEPTTRRPLTTEEPTTLRTLTTEAQIVTRPSNGQLDVMLLVNNIDDMPAHVDSLVQFISDLLDGLGMGPDGVLVGASIWFTGYFHQSSPAVILALMTREFNTHNSLGVSFANAQFHLTTSMGGVPRPGVAQVAIYISQGFTNDDAYYSRTSIEPLPDRYFVVGTHDANWNNLDQYNVDPENRFTMDQLDTLLYALYALM